MTPIPAGASTLETRMLRLRSHFLLYHLSNADLIELANLSHVSRFDVNESIFRQGDREPDLMILTAGRVKLSATSREGKELLVNVVERGHIFGEIAVIDGRPRSFDATSIVRSEVLVVRRRDLLPFLKRKPDICLKFLECFCERLRRSESQIQDAVFLGVGPRLARQLLRLGQVHGRTEMDVVIIDFPITQQDLANMVGATRESINKQLCQWRRAEIIWFKGRSLRILRKDLLYRHTQESRSLSDLTDLGNLR